ncbi:uncharacterized protein LOC105174764 isoform X2 [Sesamum indicum]|uniref:Uncharacterized protein LOC105174764 isoform X2 n=1 Tax=Sesamum indicum TaxID=4182 RepID=A0A6I9ULE6_SESIN|nr:uncharacterized protein LOC105174764 isoform X2 [Sesamum indicum]
MGITEELRWTAAKLLNVGRIAVDSAVNESLKGGKQVYAIVKGKLKGIPHSDPPSGDKKQSFLLVEEMQAKLEKMQEDMNRTQQESLVSALRREEQEHLRQLFDEPVKSSSPEVTGPRKIFIRSRL